jgi:hypothetical protein
MFSNLIHVRVYSPLGMGAGDQSCEAVPLQKLSFLRIAPFFICHKENLSIMLNFFLSSSSSLFKKRKKFLIFSDSSVYIVMPILQNVSELRQKFGKFHFGKWKWGERESASQKLKGEPFHV